MKRLLSTLTALCMCASMSVGMLPASALSAISTDDTAVVRADSGLMARAGESDAHNKGYEWCVEDATFDPANPPKGNVIQMPITVWNDPGTAGVNAKILVDGKELTDSTTDDFPFTLALMKQGSAYSFETFMPNPAIGDFGMAVAGNGGEPQTAEQGGQGLVIAFKLKDGAELTPGKEYKIGLTSEENSFVGANKVVLNPQPILTAGTLKIAGGEDTTTAPTPQDTTAPAPQDTTAPVAENNHDNGYEWCVEDAKFDPKNPPKGNVIQMPITVWNDPGTAGVNAKILVDGKELTDSTTDDFPFTLALMKQGSAYSFETFMPNPAIGDFGMAVAGNGGEPQTAEQGGQGLTIAFKLKDGAELTPGKKYKIELTAEENSFVGANKVVLNPQPILTPGYLIIAGEDDPIEPPISEDYKWYVEDAEFDPKTDENVLANIKVAGDPGTFAYYFFITIDGKSPADADFPFELKAVKGGDAYPQASGFAGNIAGGKAAGTTENPSAEKNGFATDNGTAVTYVLAAKEGVTYTPGTKYEVKIANSKFTNYEKQVLFPDLESGFITIKGEAQTTDAPTDAPTEPDATDPPFEHKQKEVDAKWIIGHDTVAPGAEVTIPVYVEGNTDGFNSYIADIKAADGPVLKDGSNGKISANLNFVENPDKLIFSATNFTKDGEMVKGDGDVFYMTFTAPTKPGKYALDFENLEIYDIDMVQLIPKTENGWIEVKADETDFEHKKQDTAAKWVIGKVEIDAGTTTARVPVSVQGASEEADGINSYIAKIKQDAGPKATGAEAGTAYAELGLQQNLNDLDLIFAGTNSDQKKNITAADGDVFYIDFEIPADAAPGTTYNLKFADLELENMDMVQLIPKTEDGWIKIKEAETTTTEPIEVGDAGMWVIGTATVAPGEKVTIPVTVTGDKNGINSFIMNMGNPGKGGVTPTPESAEKGNAYGEQISFVPNIANMTFGSTNFELGENLMLTKDGAVVFNVTFTAPTEPGTYDLTFEDLSVYDINMSLLTPEKKDGWIKVIAESTTTEEPVQTTAEPVQTTAEPVQTTAEPVQTTAEPVQTTAEPVQTTTEPIVIGDAGMWIIGTDTVAPGATVTIPVTVTGDKNGINSFIMKMGNPGKGGVTPTPESAEKGNAYGEAMNFVPNIANMTFGSTNFTLGENVMLTEDGAVVFNVTFTAPTEPGTYDLTFEDLSVYDINMSLLTPEKKDGWIKVVAESTTTSEQPVQTTAAPVDTTAAPVDTTAAPVDTTAAPVDTTAAPVDTTAAPVDTTAAPVQTTAEPVQTTTEPIVIGDAGMWIIGTDTVAPGATVTIPVTVTGDKNGINSFIMKMGNPGKDGITPTPESAEKGNAYGEAMNFVPNIANMTFGSTNFTLGENVMLTEDGAVVFNVTFTAPTEPGTYDLTFEDLSVYDINMSLLTPEKKDGWIKVVAESTTTSEQPVQTTTTSEEPVPVQTTTTSEEPVPVQTTTTSEEPVPVQTTTTSEEPVPVQTTTTSEEPVPVQTTTTSEEPVPVQTTTTSEEPVPVQTTTTSEEPVPVQTTTTSEEPVPVQTTTTSEEPAPVQTTTTSEEPQPIETTTTSDVVKPAHEYEVTWEIGKDIGYAGESVELPIIVKGDVDEAMVYNSYLFTLEIADGPILKPESIRSGSAYSEMAIEANGLQIAGTNSTGDSEGYNGATILYLTFDLPADLAAGKYDVKFAGDVEAHNRALDIFNITEENGYIQVIPKDVTLEQKEFQFDVEGLSKFYFSHDHREFIKDGLLQSELISLGSLMARPVLSDPTIETEWAPADLDKIEFNLKDETLTSPKAVFDTKVAPTLDDTFGKAFFKGQVAFTISTSFDTYNPETGEIETVEQKDTDTLYDGSPMVTGNIYIGVKGDTNLNGTANAQDAGSQLVYAAEFGSGMNPNILTVESDMITAIQAEGEEAAKELENFVYFLSDVTDESEDHGDTSSILDGTATIDAKDASKVLIYAAQFGSGMNPDWYRVLDEPLPKYTKLIGAADGNNDKS